MAVPEPDDPGGRSTVELVLGIVAALLLVVGVVAVIGGQGDDGKKVDAAALLSGAPDALRKAGSARTTMTMSVKAGGVSLETEANGVTEFATGRGTFSMSVFGNEMEVRNDGTNMYIRIPAGSSPSVSKPWVSMPISAMTAAGPTSLGGADSTTAYLDALRGIGGAIETIGSEKVNGVDTTHYHAVIRLADAIAKTPEAIRAQAEAGLKQLDQLGIAEMPVDVWISDDGLPVRQVMTFDAPGGVSALAGMKMRMQMDLSDFGVPVEVEVPPADQVQPIDPTQLGSLFGGVGGLPES